MHPRGRLAFFRTRGRKHPLYLSAIHFADGLLLARDSQDAADFGGAGEAVFDGTAGMLPAGYHAGLDGQAFEGRRVGTITSSAQVPGDDQSIALGIVRTSHAKPGTAVAVRTNERENGATIFWNEDLETTL